MRWHEFEDAAPNISRIGKGLLYSPDRAHNLVAQGAD